MIGRAAAHLFASKGMKLMLLGHSQDKLDALDLPSQVAKTRTLDITDEDEVQSAIDEAEAHFGRIDCVLQNVAIYPWKLMTELSLEEWEETLRTNLTGPFLTTRACSKVMRKQKGGRILFVSSVGGDPYGIPYMSAYAATKSGLNGFMRSVALELAQDNILVNSISPGKIYDPITLSDEEIQEKTKDIPLKKFQTPEDVAELGLFLFSDKANSITGQNYVVDGGYTIRG